MPVPKVVFVKTTVSLPSPASTTAEPKPDVNVIVSSPAPALTELVPPPETLTIILSLPAPVDKEDVNLVALVRSVAAMKLTSSAPEPVDTFNVDAKGANVNAPVDVEPSIVVKAVNSATLTVAAEVKPRVNVLTESEVGVPDTWSTRETVPGIEPEFVPALLPLTDPVTLAVVSAAPLNVTVPVTLESATFALAAVAAALTVFVTAPAIVKV